MGLNEETKAALIAAMGKTPKGLRGAKDEGGHFYFLADNKGAEGALVVLAKSKDSDGKKTFRTGRGLLKDFKKGGAKPLYSQGELAAGSPLVFRIQKGSAKPALLARAFKKCDMIHAGVGSALVGALKGAKITMGGASSAPPDTATTDEAVAAWADTPEAKALIADLGLSSAELRALYDAQRAFAGYTEAMPMSADEDTALQIQQAETEALLDELAEGDARLALLKAQDPIGDETLALEDTLNEKRIALAQKSAVGPSPFVGEELSEVDKQALTVSVRAGLELLLARIEALRAEIATEHEKRTDPTGSDPDVLERRRSELANELTAVTEQFQTIRLPV